VAALMWLLSNEKTTERNHLTRPPQKEEQVMVIYFGGGTCDVAIVTVDENQVRLRHADAIKIGGEQIDDILYREFNEYLFNTKGKKIDESYVECRVMKQIEQFKIDLNKKIKEKSPLESHSDVIVLDQSLGHVRWELSFEKFRQLLGDLESESVNITSANKKDSSIQIVKTFGSFIQKMARTFKSIGKVYLVGGSSQLYFVRREVLKAFERSESDENSFIELVDLPQRVVACGASFHQFRRISHKRFFISKLPYEIALETEKGSIVLVDEGQLLDNEFIYKKIKPVQTLGEESYLRFKFSQAGPALSDHKPIQKEIQPDYSRIPTITPLHKIKTEAKISIDGLVFLKALIMNPRTHLKVIEPYPVLLEEGLSEYLHKAHRMIPFLQAKQ